MFRAGLYARVSIVAYKRTASLTTSSASPSISNTHNPFVAGLVAVFGNRKPFGRSGPSQDIGVLARNRSSVPVHSQNARVQPVLLGGPVQTSVTSKRLSRL
jgi:hypothetical protein